MDPVRKKLAPRNSYWFHGELLHLANSANISYGTLINIVHRLRRPSYQTAEELDLATKIMKRHIPKEVWLDNFDSDHPAFRAKEIVEVPVTVPAVAKVKYKRNPYWSCGEIRAVYEEARISKRTLVRILHRDIPPTYPVALRLEEATESMGRPIDWQTWLDNQGSTHPAFSGEPIKKSRRPDMMTVNIDKKDETNPPGSV